MQLSLTTPAVLFSATSLLLLAYTNRFLAIAQLVRNLHTLYKEKPDQIIFGQIRNLRIRLELIRSMQICGIISLLLCVVCMFLLYIDLTVIADIIFGIGLLLLIASLALSAWEIQISVRALNLHLGDMNKEK
jgi:hypothetical protein